MEMQTFGKRPGRRERLPRPDDRDGYWARDSDLMRVGQNYELARELADRTLLGPDLSNGRSISASSGYGTREDSSSSEDFGLRSLPGASIVGRASRAGDPMDCSYNPALDIQMERNGNYYSSVKPVVTVVKPRVGVKVRARISLPPSPTCEQDDNYNFCRQPEYGKLEVNLGDMLERLQSDLVGLRDSLSGDMKDAEPLLNSTISATKAVKSPDRPYQQLESTRREKGNRSDYTKPKWNVPFHQRLLQEFSGSGRHGLKTALNSNARPWVR